MHGLPVAVTRLAELVFFTIIVRHATGWLAQRARKGRMKNQGKCQGPVTPGCLCAGDCGSITSCHCGPCVTAMLTGITAASTTNVTTNVTAPAPVRPARPARPQNAGMEGFDEKSAEFGFAIGSVRGIRQWNWEIGDALHRSVNARAQPSGALLRPAGAMPRLRGVHGGLWEDGVNVATCANFADHVPPVEYDDKRHRQCGCGFWGYWQVDARSWNNKLPVWGVIEGTGRVVIGERGFRCQKARILGLAPGFTVEPRSARDQYRSSQGSLSVRTEDHDEEAEKNRVLAQAWMAVVLDELGLMYPSVRVFATVKGLLATFPTGEVTQ